MCINRHVREKEKQEENTKDLQGYLDIDEEIDIFKIKTVSIVRYTNDMPICKNFVLYFSMQFKQDSILRLNWECSKVV